MNYLTKKIDFIKNNVLNYNVNLMLNLSNSLIIYNDFLSVIAFLILIWNLFYENISFSKKVTKTNIFNSIDNLVIFLFSIILGLFCVAPYLFFKIIYFDVDNDLSLLTNIYTYYENVNFYESNNISLLSNNYDLLKNQLILELLNSKIYFKWW